ncbi:MAG TPA: cobyrinic acid a,c-diamide synthase [Cyanobacteria bacterium UBA8803]|nr:cobyrinic acid a,c-diamide synthase [Cyanobacteria bacterium UBA9273]HBL58368.1 cobyrinic acid a,c-diamide synthase [Cyanobacteria bacterium UBA8803]
MGKSNYQLASSLQEDPPIGTLDKTILEVTKWVEHIPLEQRIDILYLCYLICVNPPDQQSELTELLEDYAVDSLVAKMLQERIIKVLDYYLKYFSIKQELNQKLLKNYIKRFYIHSVHDLYTPDCLYLEILIHLLQHSEERIKLFSYILGFEIIKIIFQMSWLQHERLYQLQKNQEDFINNYIKPIQYAHRLNGIIIPKDENLFFAKRAYFIKVPIIKEKKLIELIMCTFSRNKITSLGFSIIHNLKLLSFDYDYIFNSEPDGIFFA